MGKTHIGELFVKERVLKLPLPWTDGFRFAITERSLRLLITSLIVLFLALMGGTLLLQLTDSRATHLAEQNSFSALYGRAAAEALKADAAAARAKGLEPQAMTSAYLETIVPAKALEEGRIFAIVENSGRIAASLPAAQQLDGLPVTSLLAPDFIVGVAINSGDMAPLQLANGDDAFAGIYDLGDYPGSLFVLQRKADVLQAWRAGVTRVTALFIVTLFVLMLLGGAFHWQAARAVPSRCNSPTAAGCRSTSGAPRTAASFR